MCQPIRYIDLPLRNSEFSIYCQYFSFQINWFSDHFFFAHELYDRAMNVRQLSTAATTKSNRIISIDGRKKPVKMTTPKVFMQFVQKNIFDHLLNESY